LIPNLVRTSFENQIPSCCRGSATRGPFLPPSLYRYCFRRALVPDLTLQSRVSAAGLPSFVSPLRLAYHFVSPVTNETAVPTALELEVRGYSTKMSSLWDCNSISQSPEGARFVSIGCSPMFDGAQSITDGYHPSVLFSRRRSNTNSDKNREPSRRRSHDCKE
jgi:hypothetical protein